MTDTEDLKQAVFRATGGSGRAWDFTVERSLDTLPDVPGIFVLLAVPPARIGPPRALFFGRAETGLADTIPRHEKFEPAIRMGLNAFGVIAMDTRLDEAQADLLAGTPTPLNAQRDALREITALTDLHRTARNVAAE
ncbi:hypothetical protein GLS40_10840 [Pseudooceanicola sp. 216_PA32_1]|uniref:Uncharacterized protein n=1 Tax=Pseudooceanicola pacificus TaxID=2676438 RepID=A0A844WBI1_9RHOB|nr:hypothetical protein [Pseudooceanicola pacificus]MWB78523.1 hypothetical protein [Pseudooceanicola pacificus]